MTTPTPPGNSSPDPHSALPDQPARSAVPLEHTPRTKPNWKAGILGCALGAVLVIGLLGVAVTSTLASRQAPATPTRAAVRITPKTWPTPTPLPQGQPGIEPTPDVFREAQEMINGGQSQGAIELLGPQADQLATEALRKNAYQLLAQAELNLSNYNLAAAYLEKAQAIQTDAVLMQNVADAYYQGGSLECALDRYQAVLKQRDPALDAVRPTIEARVAVLKQMFPTQIPCK
jgi:hypothetical protein